MSQFSLWLGGFMVLALALMGCGFFALLSRGGSWSLRIRGAGMSLENLIESEEPEARDQAPSVPMDNER